MTFKKLRNQENRKAGFEFEMSGIDINESAELIKELFSGEIQKKHSLETIVSCPNYGDFKIELDAQMVKELAKKLENKENLPDNELLDFNKINSFLSKAIGDISKQVVPFEIVTPPLKFTDFEKLDKLVENLRKNDAKGTKANILNAFGLHINPQIPSEEVSDIKDILRSFILLYPYLLEKMQIDISRRITNFIDPFPKEYGILIANSDYQPSIHQFIDDYLKHNPTRDRALDLLPLFAYLKPDCLNNLKSSEKKLVKSRPTFHFRLPNCEIDNKDWSVSSSWNYWILIEEIAFDKEKLNFLSKQYLENLNNQKKWIKILEEELL